MKKILLFGLILLSSCVQKEYTSGTECISSNIKKVNTSLYDTRFVSTFQYNNHQYILFSPINPEDNMRFPAYSSSVVHDPDCSCHKTTEY